jgi:hypothetical protein
MDMHVEELVRTMEQLLKEDDAETAWYLQKDFANVWNAQAPDSPERQAMAAVWKKMMIKWH